MALRRRMRERKSIFRWRSYCVDLRTSRDDKVRQKHTHTHTHHGELHFCLPTLHSSKNNLCKQYLVPRASKLRRVQMRATPQLQRPLHNIRRTQSAT